MEQPIYSTDEVANRKQDDKAATIFEMRGKVGDHGLRIGTEFEQPAGEYLVVLLTKTECPYVPHPGIDTAALGDLYHGGRNVQAPHHAPGLHQHGRIEARPATGIKDALAGLGLQHLHDQRSLAEADAPEPTRGNLVLVTFGLSIKIMADTAVVQSSTSSIDHHTVASLTGRVISSRNASQKTKLMVQYCDGRGYSGA